MQLVKFGTNFVIRFEKVMELGQNLLKNIPLATEAQPKLDPWLRKYSQKQTLAMEIGLKRDPCGKHTPSKE